MRSSFLACLFAAWANAAQASPIDHFGFGARGPSIGNATVALDDPLSSSIDNAAAASATNDVTVGLGYSYALVDLSLNSRDSGTADVHGAWAALTVPFDFDDFTVATSFALSMPDEFILRVHSVPATEPQWILWNNGPHRVVFNGALAARYRDLVALGVGLTFLGDAGGPGVVFDVDSSAERTVADVAVDVDLPMRVAPTIGLLVMPSEKLRLGVRFEDEISLDVHIDVNARVRIEGTAVDGNVHVLIDGTNYFSPRKLVFGASYDIGPLTLSTQLDWQAWSRLARVGTQVNLDVDLGVPVPTRALQVPDAAWNDILVPRVGAEVRQDLDEHHALTLRAGYWFAPSPVPSQQGVTSYADASRHVFTFGGALSFDELGFPTSLEVALQAHFFEERETNKRSGAPASRFTADGTVFFLSTGARSSL